MAKSTLVAEIDLGLDTPNPKQITSRLYQSSDETPPPIPTGFSVPSALGGVRLTIDFNVDTAHLVQDFQSFIAFRAESLDASGQGIAPQEILRFGTSTIPYDIDIIGKSAYFAIKAQDFAGNSSDFSVWTLGIGLRDTGVQDDFSTFGGAAQVANDSELNWLQIATCDEAGWVFGNGALSTSNVVEGVNTLRLNGTFVSLTATLTKSFDLDNEGRFTDDDYVAIFVKVVVQASGTNFLFFTDSGNFFLYDLKTLGVGDNYVIAKKSDFFEAGIGTPDWGNIDSVGIQASSPGAAMDVYYDDIRIVKASPSDPTAHSDTADLWLPLPDKWLASESGEFHIYEDMGDSFPFALGQIQTGTETYLAVREDRQQEDATHTAAQQIRYADGVAGMLLRVSPSPIRLDTPTLNAMFTDFVSTPIEKTHTPTEGGAPIYGEDSATGSFITLSAADSLSYASVSLPNSNDEFTVHVVVEAAAAGIPPALYTVFEHKIDANNLITLDLQYVGGIIWLPRINGFIGGVAISATSIASIAWLADEKMTFTVSNDGGLFTIYHNGIVVSTSVTSPSSAYPSTNGTLYIGADSAAGNDFAGKYYQVLVEPEDTTEAFVLEWHLGFLNGIKVANATQRNFYAYEIDTTLNLLKFTKHRIGFDAFSLSPPVSFVSTVGTIYYLAVIVENQDLDGDGIVDQVLIRAFVSTSAGDILIGDNQSYSTVDAASPMLSGGVGFRSIGTNVRWSNFQAGSPHRAHTAQHAITSDGFKTVGRVPKYINFVEQVGTPATPPAGEFRVYAEDDGFIYGIDDTGTKYNLTTAGGGAAAPADAEYLVLSANAGLSDERIITIGTALTETDAGAGLTYTIDHATGDFGDLHTNYAEHDQTETITGAWTFNTNVAAGGGITVDGVDISAHAADADAHHAAFIALEDNAGMVIAPAVDNRIQVTDDGIINADASGDTLALSISQSSIDHGSLGGLTGDDHAQYLLLLGRAGGQVAYGSTLSGEGITIESTSHATKGPIILAPSGGKVFINESVNTFMDTGLTITASTTNEMITIKKSGVAHGVTTQTETDTVGLIKPTSTFGGLTIRSLREATDGTASLVLSAWGSTTVTAKGTTSGAKAIISAANISGTTLTTVGANGNLLAIRDYLTNKLIIDTESTIHHITGSDIDVDLITVQVTGAPTLSWDESEDKFDLSKGLNVTGHIERTDFIFSAYSTASTTFTTPALAVVWSVETRKDAQFTHVGGSATVTIDEAGDYKITAHVTTVDFASAGDSDTLSYILKNGVKINGSSGLGNNRGSGANASIAMFAVVTAAATDTITVEVVRNNGTATLALSALSASRIMIERI